MEMMDLPAYVDSFRQGYDSAMQDLYSRATSAFGSAAPWMSAQAPYPYGPPSASAPPQAWYDRGDRHRHHEHHHGCECEDCRHREHDCGREHEHHHDCGCGHEHHHERCDRDCRCDCCIVDADIVVYSHCGEVRVIPIEIENDTRKVREDVTLDVSDVRSGGGRTLPWKTLLRPAGPLTIEPCSKVKLELLVHILCEEAPSGETKRAPAKAAAATKAAGLLEAVAEQRDLVGDVDRCEVGYVTIRVGGCLVRPIVVAIAVLPNTCDSYRASCSCSCCC
jgi:hypothetical protein